MNVTFPAHRRASRRVLRRLLFTAAPSALAFLVAACGSDGEKEPEPEDMSSVTFINPVEGTDFTSDDDLDPDTEGIQVAVTLGGMLEDGDAVALRAGTDDSYEWTVAGGMAAWPSDEAIVTLVDGDNVLQASATRDGEVVASASVTVRGLLPVIQPPALLITSPTNGDTITEADDVDSTTLGVQIDVTARAERFDAGASAALSVNDAGSIDELIVDGELLYANVTVIEGENTLTLTADSADGPITDEITITLEVEAPLPCAVSLTPEPVGDTCNITSASDDVSDAEGIQTQFEVTTDCFEANLQVNGDGVGVNSVDGGGVATFLVTLPEGRVEVQATADGVNGRSGTGQLYIFDVDTLGPAVTITDTFDSAILPEQDEDTETPGLQLTISGVAEDLASVSVTANGLPAATATADDVGQWSATVTFESGGDYSLVAEATDACGNLSVDDPVVLDVFTEAPTITLTEPVAGSVLTAADDVASLVPGLQVNVRAESTLRPEVEATLSCRLTAPADSAFEELGTGTVGSTGAVRIQATFEEGEYECQLSATTPIAGSSDPVVFSVDLTAPELVMVTPSNSAPIGAADASPTGGVGSVDFVIDVSGADGGSVQLLIDDAVVAEATDITSPVSFAEVALPEGNVDVVVRMTDANGNSADSTISYIVDWFAPAAPTPFLTALNPRSGLVSVQLMEDPTLTSVEVRHSLVEITDANWDSADVSDGEVFAAPFTVTEGQIEVTASGLAFQTTSFVGVRVTDLGGNVSPVGSASVFIGLQALSVATLAADDIKDIIGPGDLNGDGFDDIVASADGVPVVVVYGAATSEDVVVSELDVPADTGLFGRSLSRVGDVNDDGFDDLLVVAPTTSTPAANGSAFLYFGSDTAGLAATPDVVLTYADAGGLTVRFGLTDFDGRGDVVQVADESIDDVVIGTDSGAAPGAGRVLIVAGRETWPAQIDITEDAVTNGANSVFQIEGVLSGSDFGTSVSIVEDIDGDGFDEMLLGGYNSTTAPAGVVSLFLGRAATGFSDGSGAEPVLTADDADSTFTGPTTPSVWARFGIVTPGDLTGDGTADWVVFDQNEDAFDVYAGSDPFPTTGTRFNGLVPDGLALVFGRTVCGAGDLDDDGDIDLTFLLGRAVASTDDTLMAWMLNDGTGAFPAEGQLDFTSTSSRANCGVGDFNGDGYSDVASGAPGVADTAIFVYR